MVQHEFKDIYIEHSDAVAMVVLCPISCLCSVILIITTLSIKELRTQPNDLVCVVAFAEF